jgi:XTP/dITP diphosphohydrolase
MNNKSKIIKNESGVRKLVFASDNVNKQQEIRKLMPAGYNIISLHEAGIRGPLPETGATLRANALQKALAVAERTGLDCFADDTGLEVEALNGQPGVHSARYAGPGCRAGDNIRKLLGEMSGLAGRRAVFRTVIAAVIGGGRHFFEGEVQGRIAEHPRGAAGFGYDPVFIPEGSSRTFAEMSLSEKNGISHRARALQRFTAFLRSLPPYDVVDNPVE